MDEGVLLLPERGKELLWAQDNSKRFLEMKSYLALEGKRGNDWSGKIYVAPTKGEKRRSLATLGEEERGSTRALLLLLKICPEKEKETQVPSREGGFAPAHPDEEKEGGLQPEETFLVVSGGKEVHTCSRKNVLRKGTYILWPKEEGKRLSFSKGGRSEDGGENLFYFVSFIENVS